MGAPSNSEGREDPPRERQQGRTAMPVPSGRFQLETAAGLRKRRCAAGSSPCRRRRSADPARAGPAAATADEMEAIVAAEGAAVLSDEQHARLAAHFREGVSPDGIAL